MPPMASRGRRFKSCPRCQGKCAGQRPFLSHPEAASDASRAPLSAGVSRLRLHSGAHDPSFTQGRRADVRHPPVGVSRFVSVSVRQSLVRALVSVAVVGRSHGTSRIGERVQQARAAEACPVSSGPRGEVTCVPPVRHAPVRRDGAAFGPNPRSCELLRA